MKNAVQLLDLLAKVYLNSIVFAPITQPILIIIIQKFIGEEAITELTIKLIKIALAMYYASEKKKRPKEKLLPLYNNKAA